MFLKRKNMAFKVKGICSRYWEFLHNKRKRGNKVLLFIICHLHFRLSFLLSDSIIIQYVAFSKALPKVLEKKRRKYIDPQQFQ